MSCATSELADVEKNAHFVSNTKKSTVVELADSLPFA